jgi:murein DD-endopeptidase MepM/ murein hydrolase activator NlpD
MRHFLADFLSTHSAPRTVVVMDDDSTGAPRQYRVTPARLLWGAVAAAVVLVVVTAAVTVYSPLQRLMPGYEAKQALELAAQQQARLDALQDSLRLQQDYTLRLRQLMGGIEAPRSAVAVERAVPVGRQEESEAPVVTSWSSRSVRSNRPTGAASFSALLPQGVLTRGFDASTGHFAVDIAAAEGSPVRAVEDGIVVLADWTHEGGYTIAIQHASGFVSVYKHNSQLLRATGERVAARDVVALSGNTGQVTTGPHIHLELWQDGVPMDPESFLLTL